MYYAHFGLNEAPFRITPNTDFFFSGGNRGPVLEALIYAITHGEGIVKVTGEVGSGKTMLCSMLQNRLPDEVERVYLANPNVAPEDVLHAIAFELQLGIDRGADRLELIHALQDYLVKRHAEGKRVVVFIEESQSMPLATLEEVRLLSNLETRTDKLLQIVLFGQPELDDTLRRNDIRQLRDRIAHSFRLEPLTLDQVRDYLNFRMRAAGYRGPDVFSPPVVAQIAKASSGLTRRINLIADKALLAAFSENTHTIEARHVQAALKDSEFGEAHRTLPRRETISPYAWAAAALVTGTVIGAGIYALLGDRPARVEAPRPSVKPAATSAPESTHALEAPAVASSHASPVGASPMRPAAADKGSSATDGGLSVPGDPIASASAAPVASAASAPAPQVQPAMAPATATAPVATTSPAPIAPVAAPMSAAVARPATGDLITDRLAATDALLRAQREAYSIQLMVAMDDAQLRRNLRELQRFIELDDVYMYRSVAHGRPAMSVLWGAFPNRKAAEEELYELPRSLRAARPYVRTLSSIRADVERHAGMGHDGSTTTR